MTPESFPAGRDVAFVLSAEQARAVVERARDQWGADRDAPSTLRHAVVRLCLGEHNTHPSRRRVPVGCFHAGWNYPAGGQATIDRLEWDPALAAPTRRSAG